MSTVDGTTTALAIGGRTTSCKALQAWRGADGCSEDIGAFIFSYDKLINEEPDEILVMSHVTWNNQEFQVIGVKVI